MGLVLLVYRELPWPTVYTTVYMSYSPPLSSNLLPWVIGEVWESHPSTPHHRFVTPVTDREVRESHTSSLSTPLQRD